MPKAVFLLTLLSCSFGVLAQQSAIPPPVVCYAGELDAFTQVLRKTNENQRRISTSNIEVTYNNFPAPAQVAFEHAVSIWESFLNSKMPIKINATWENLNEGTLAFSGATRIFRNIDNVPYFDVWYVGPLAEAIAGKELNDGGSDINVTLNSNINWSYDTDGSVFSGKFDLVTVALHEIAHGLGFSSSFKLINNNSEGQWGQTGFPYVYDTFLQNESDVVLTNQENYFNPSAELKQEMIGSNVFFNVSNDKFTENLPKIYSPNPYQKGGSISHLDEQKYPSGSEHSLMSPKVTAAEVNHEPGGLALSMLNQMGWLVNNLDGLVLGKEKELEPRILVFPNPSSREIAVAMPIGLRAKETRVTFYQGNGKTVLNFKKDTELEPTFYLPVANLPAGIYFLKVSSEKGELVKRVVKE